MQNTSLTNQSASKQQLLDELRERYEAKYGNDQEVKEVIKEQLEKIKAKPRLSLTDLNEIDTMVSQVSKSLISKSTAHSRQKSTSNLLRGHVTSSASPFRLPAIDPPTSRSKKLPELKLQSDKLFERDSDKHDEDKPRQLTKSHSLSSYNTPNLNLSKHTFDFSPANPKMLTTFNQSVAKLEKTYQYVTHCSNFQTIHV